MLITPCLRLKSYFCLKAFFHITFENIYHICQEAKLLFCERKLLKENLKILELKVTGFYAETIFVNFSGFDLRLTQINAENKFSWNVVNKSHDSLEMQQKFPSLRFPQKWENILLNQISKCF